MLTGYADPITFLSLAGDDLDIATEVVRKARQIQNDERMDWTKAVIKTLGTEVGNAVGQQIGRIFR